MPQALASEAWLTPAAADACRRDIDRFRDELSQAAAGTLPPALFKARRVMHGTYEQRASGTFMVRTRVPAGVLSAAQSEALAAIAERWGGGTLHVTTRQDVQFHEVAAADVPAVMQACLAAGLPCRGTGGNTPRNVVACPLAGVCPHEAFDVTPSALGLTRFLLDTAGEYDLPRKFKVAFSGCACDCGQTAVADVGFVASVRQGEPGYAVWAGGGLGQQCRLADRLEEWVPAAAAPEVVLALLRLFERHGDRANRARARLRFAFDRLGAAQVLDEYRSLRTAATRTAATAPRPAGGEPLPPPAARPWCGRREEVSGLRVAAQCQPGLVSVLLQPAYGVLAAADLRVLASAAVVYSTERGLRATPAQGLLLRGVARARLPELAAALRLLSPAFRREADGPEWIVCTGAATCRLGLCDARATTRALMAAVRAAGLGGTAVADVDIRVNGCGNQCAQAPLADIGLVGCMGQAEGRAARAYRVVVGARRGAGTTRFGEAVAIVSEEGLAAALCRLLAHVAAQRQTGEAFGDYVARAGLPRLAAVLETAGASGQGG